MSVPSLWTPTSEEAEQRRMGHLRLRPSATANYNILDIVYYDILYYDII